MLLCDEDGSRVLVVLGVRVTTLEIVVEVALVRVSAVVAINLLLG